MQLARIIALVYPCSHSGRGGPVNRSSRASRLARVIGEPRRLTRPLAPVRVAGASRARGSRERVFVRPSVKAARGPGIIRIQSLSLELTGGRISLFLGGRAARAALGEGDAENRLSLTLVAAKLDLAPSIERRLQSQTRQILQRGGYPLRLRRSESISSPISKEHIHLPRRRGCCRVFSDMLTYPPASPTPNSEIRTELSSCL